MRCEIRTVLCGAALAIVASGCQLPVGTMEMVARDGTVMRVPITSVRVQQEMPPEGLPDGLSWQPAPVAHLEADLGEQRSFSLDVTLEPSGTWSWSDVCSHDRPGYCDRYPVDVDGDGRADHSVRRTGSLDGTSETVRAWAIFADDDEGPREVSAAFRFAARDVVLVPSTATFSDAP